MVVCVVPYHVSCCCFPFFFLFSCSSTSTLFYLGFLRSFFSASFLFKKEKKEINCCWRMEAVPYCSLLANNNRVSRRGGVVTVCSSKRRGSCVRSLGALPAIRRRRECEREKQPPQKKTTCTAGVGGSGAWPLTPARIRIPDMNLFSPSRAFSFL